jgi:hypothetical protein
MVLILGLEIPVYFFWIVGAAIALTIYLYLNEYQQHQVGLFAKKYGIWVGLILCWLMFYNSLGQFQYGDFFNKKANVCFIIISLIVGLTYSFMYRERYFSTHAICNNRHGSCAEYEFAGDYVLLNIGSCDYDFPLHKGNETWVVPRKHFNKINGKPNTPKAQIYIKTKVTQCEIGEIPSYCYHSLIKNDSFNKEKIYFGMFSLEELEDKNTTLEDHKGNKLSPEMYEAYAKEVNISLNNSREINKGNMDNIKRQVSNLDQIRKKASGINSFNSNPNSGGEQRQ